MTANKNPLISIIVPIYNVEPYLRECLESLINQSYTNLDIVLVDDGSLDSSLDIALEYARKDERIFIISTPNLGLGNARNIGLEFIKHTPLRTMIENPHKQGKPIYSFTQTHAFTPATKMLTQSALQEHFTAITPNFIRANISNINDLIIQELPSRIIHFVDSDDYLSLDCMESCARAMEDSHLEICAHNLIEYFEGNKTFKHHQRLGIFKKVRKDSYDFGAKLLSQNHIYDFYFAWQGCFRSEILNRYNLRFTNGIFHEDHDFGTLLFCLAKKVGYIGVEGYIYRSRPNSVTSSQKQTAFPPNLPTALQPLKPYFENYKDLRDYFKAYCYCIVALKIWTFYIDCLALEDAKYLESTESTQAKSIQTSAQDYKRFFEFTILNHLQIFKTSLKIDPLGIKQILKTFNLSKFYTLLWFFKDLHRQPKKLKFIGNLRYLL
ncbi:glycosyl transferase family A [Helicobacter sp. MIT 00-7814]|uniref:glycosyltransferase family 2 protein n=1 Tax=unclassified Helicobacter TaxID=2593540 RepID=UPI000E1EDCC2|nr:MULTISPECIES: glycosyltransferase family 2 protein [unclassified Helicobacter]RDU54612.1 glycosyl transferase family A [Helicobacter sp. MIT 00-7814]RDU54671.1 glycosyl transferase family A [Helicobacter sp. MIT 99-10781]